MTYTKQDFIDAFHFDYLNFHNLQNSDDNLLNILNNSKTLLESFKDINAILDVIELNPDSLVKKELFKYKDIFCLIKFINTKTNMSKLGPILYDETFDKLIDNAQKNFDMIRSGNVCYEK